MNPECVSLMDDLNYIKKVDKRDKLKYIFFSDKCVLLLSYDSSVDELVIEKLMKKGILEEVDYKKIMELLNKSKSNPKDIDDIFDKVNDIITDKFGDYGYDEYEKAIDEYTEYDSDYEDPDPDDFFTPMKVKQSEIKNLQDNRSCIRYYLACILKNTRFIEGLESVSDATKIVLSAEDYTLLPYLDENGKIDQRKFAKLVRAYESIGFTIDDPKSVLSNLNLTPHRTKIALERLTPEFGKKLFGGKRKSRKKRKSSKKKKSNKRRKSNKRKSNKRSKKR